MNITKITTNNAELKEYLMVELNNYDIYKYVIDKTNCIDNITINFIEYLNTIDLENIDVKKLDNKLKEELNTYINNEISDPNKTIIILNRYINIHTSTPLDYNKKIKFLNKLSEFLVSVNYTMTPDIIEKIIKENNNLNDILMSIVNKNKKKIEKGKAYEIFENETIVSLIEVYANLNNIKVDNIEHVQGKTKKRVKRPKDKN